MMRESLWDKEKGETSPLNYQEFPKKSSNYILIYLKIFINQKTALLAIFLLPLMDDV